MLAALILFGGPAVAQDNDRARDLLFVISAGLYPVELMAYCAERVEDDPAFHTAAFTWREHNGEFLAQLHDLAHQAGVTEADRVAADKAALASIVEDVTRQPDPAAWCRLMAKLIEAGNFDLDKRPDLIPPLRRIFPKQGGEE